MFKFRLSFEGTEGKPQGSTTMKDLAVRSPGAKVGGLVYFGRMLDKIRVAREGRTAGRLSAESGQRFRPGCVDLLQIDYAGARVDG